MTVNDLRELETPQTLSPTPLRPKQRVFLELVRLGYRNVLNLDGGMLAWRAAGYEVLPE